jgi:hypothetical protein
MILKGLKYAAVGVTGMGLLGALVFGRDVVSYVSSSANSVRTAVKDSVPIEFELQRARDMVEGIIPELRANIRLIAEEEVEVAALKKDIDAMAERQVAAKQQISMLRDKLEVQQVSYRVKGREYSREHLGQQLAQKFDHFRQSDDILASKRRLLETRERSLEAALQMLERTRARKAQLDQQIEALAAQHRLLKAESVGTQVQIDGSKLAKAEKLITEITKRLDVAERVLQRESDFLPMLEVDALNEADLLDQVDEYFHGSHPSADSSAAGDA